VDPGGATRTRTVDFGYGPRQAIAMPWGDVFTAYYSTRIPNIQDYMVLPQALQSGMSLMMRLRPLFRGKLLRSLAKRGVRPGPTPEQRALTSTHVWGEVQDGQGGRAAALLHGPEAGLEWTIRAALAIARRALSGDAPPGYQTPAMAYGPDLVMECEGVTREDAKEQGE
jgi:short subunit dehydrogenase-like uncharacterized protein